MVHKIPINNLDHNRLIMKLNNEHVKTTKEFRYELFWKKEDDFLERVRKALNSPLRVKNNLSCFLLKLKNLEESLKG
jgi:hypothetical protein